MNDGATDHYDMPSFSAGMSAERRRIARELHDTLLQSLAALAFQISGLSKAVHLPEYKSGLNVICTEAEECLREARQAIANIRKAESKNFDLAAEFAASGRWLMGAEKPPSLHLDVKGQPRLLPVGLGEELLRIGREAITNASKHSCAEQIYVRLNYGTDSIGLQISDDGHGFNPSRASVSGHFGLLSMRERAEQIHASIVISSDVTRGTSVQVTVPNAA